LLAVLRVSSRLGDGELWVALILALPLLYGTAAIRVSLIMAATGLSGYLVYKSLKSTLVRERPYIRHTGIDMAMSPLDRYSFPSGHTLHAVNFAWQAVAHYPQLAWVLVPAASLIALSRVVLGLHYPTDVVAGAAIGAVLAGCGLAIA
jgi:undecaprenyl-diphosphatase